MDADSGLIELSSGAARARIALLGGELRAWRVGDVEALWTPDARYWEATAPILFPVCGWTREGRALVAGETYPLGLHGFARFEHFNLVEKGADFARLELRDSAATRAQYPFAFLLSLEYRLADNRLDITAVVDNTGAATMPYAFGLHPGFRWPSPGGANAGHAIRFDLPERAEVPVIAAGGLFSDARRPVVFADARTLPLDETTFEREALCFLDCASAGFELHGPAGRHLRVETENFRHMVLWSRPGAPFVCMESWTGHGDPEGFTGELAQKPSMILLAPGARQRHAARYSLG